jgi:hypothetical protein
MMHYELLAQQAVQDRLAAVERDRLVREAQRAARAARTAGSGTGRLALRLERVQLGGVVFRVVLRAVAQLLHRVRDVPVAARVP